ERGHVEAVDEAAFTGAPELVFGRDDLRVRKIDEAADVIDVQVRREDGLHALARDAARFELRGEVVAGPRPYAEEDTREAELAMRVAALRGPEPGVDERHVSFVGRPFTRLCSSRR